MILPFILAVCLCGVFCLTPLAMYLLWLAQVTRRDRPTAISGPWDFVGVLAGLSGFIVVGGGLLLTLFQSNFRYWMRGNLEALRAVWIQERSTWLMLVFFYLVIVLGISAITMIARRRTLSVYHIEPETLEAVLREIFDQLGRPIERSGKVWVSGVPLFELDTFERGHTATLRWVSGDVRLYEEVVRQLRAALATQQVGENPASRWLMAASVGLGIIAACSGGLLIYWMSLLGR